MAYQMVATAVTLNDLEGHSPVADVFTCNPSNICAAVYTISTDRARMSKIKNGGLDQYAKCKAFNGIGGERVK